MIKRTIICLTLLVFCTLPLAAGVYPNFFDDSDHSEYDLVDYMNYIAGSSYTTYDVSGLTGSYQVTAFAYEAGYNNTASLSTGFGLWPVFSTSNVNGYGPWATAFGQWIEIYNIANLFFTDSSGAVAQLISADILSFIVTSAISVPGYSTLTFNPGTIIVGWNDSWNDSDHDDLIIALTPTGGTYETVPEPGLLILFGSSLLGLALIRKKVLAAPGNSR